MKDSYAGKINNSGQQSVEAIYKQPKSSTRTKKFEGGDLRAKPSKVKK